MYINETHIAYYAVFAIIGLFVGMLVDWMNKRLPDYKKVFSKEIFTEYFAEFKPNYILMLVTSAIYVALLYFYGIRTTFIANLDLIKYMILTPMLLSAFVIDYRLQIIPNRLNLTMFEIGLVIAFLYGLSDVAITINMALGMLVGGGIFLLITLIGGAIYGKEAMGFGDVKLMGALGLYFGLSNIIAVTLLSFLIGALLSIILLATKIKKMEFSNDTRKKMLSDLGLNDTLPVILIFGGSQGAQRINENVTDLIINEYNKNYQIIWATGPKQFDIVKEKLKEHDLDIENIKNAKILPYIYNMEELINICDLVVCRSGAMTITEIAIVEKPAIFIPLPSVGANRQEDNARVMEKLGSAKVILNSEINKDNLNSYINDMIKDRNKLNQMGKLAGKIATKDVEEKIYDEIKKILNKK